MTDSREPHHANHFSGDPILPCTIPCQQDNRVSHGPAFLPAGGDRQFEGQLEWEDVPLLVRNGTMHGTLPDPYHTTNLANYGMVNYPPPPGVSTILHVVSINKYSYQPPQDHAVPHVGLAQGILAPEQVHFPENEGNGHFHFNYAPQGAEPEHTQAGLPDGLAHQAPAFGQPTRENLRRLASRYVHHPGSQVDMVQMEPGFMGRYRVVIILDMADLL
ncbi:hypothetical protein F5148DRAFT_734032 [Russula earlei]|uniref:Uncharacterized protein n=1 Tax=Russula earlei TaxID=71964 RepID=A0ACC0UMJ2_9AGAM|nr:hypothetical protein F5148DRAFT_734032 [Russula earlei]